MAKKKGKTTKEAPKLTKKQEEQLEAQKQKEAKIRAKLKEVIFQFTVQFYETLIEGDSVFFFTLIKTVFFPIQNECQMQLL